MDEAVTPNRRGTDDCLVCGGSDLEPLLVYYSKHLPRLFHRVAICKNCGHIQVFPLFARHELERINARFFGSMYMAGDQQNVANNARKLQKLDERLSRYLEENLDVLDVGAGEGWTLDYFQEKGCAYHAIEIVPRLAAIIEARGGKVIGQTIFEDYAAHEGRFDLIIFRHIIEHLLDPGYALATLRKLLRPEGKIYLALPNAQNPSVNVGFENLNEKGFRTSFIRPIHISYFCEENVHRLARSAGLAPVVSEAGAEIFCLLRPASEPPKPGGNYYARQKAIFLSAGRRSLGSDLLRIARDLPRTLARRALGRG